MTVSARALSKLSPTLPTDGSMLASAKRSVWRIDTYWTPRSLWYTDGSDWRWPPCGYWRRQRASGIAAASVGGVAGKTAREHVKSVRPDRVTGKGRANDARSTSGLIARVVAGTAGLAALAGLIALAIAAAFGWRPP